jgi:alkylation response protein AidB-like acyl-CoA dehydrogenase
MDFAFSDDQRLIRQSAEELVRRLSPMDRVRALFEPGAPDYCPELWRGLAQAGFLGTLIPEDLGGTGLGMVEMGCVLEALGGALASGPYISSAVIGVEALRLSGSSEQQRRWLPGIAKGELVLCPLLAADKGAPLAYGASADLFLIQSHGSLVAVDPNLTDAAITPFDALDPTRRFAVVDIELEGEALAKPFATADAERLRAVAAAATAAEMLGGATRAHQMASDYAKERHQFGAPIGSFQAIKHLLADQAVALEGARSAVQAALWALDHGDEDASGAVTAASIAKVAMSETALRIGVENIQVHGGMGFTAEVDAHLYLKRAQMDEMAHGGAEEHAEFLAQRLEDLG